MPPRAGEGKVRAYEGLGAEGNRFSRAEKQVGLPSTFTSRVQSTLDFCAGPFIGPHLP